MKVLFDYQAFCMQRFGGVSNSFIQLMRNFPVDVNYDLAVCESNNVHLKESGLKKVNPPRLTEENFISTRWFLFRNTLYRMYSKLFPSKTSLGRNRMCSIDSLKKGNFDVFHPTFFDDYFLPYINGKPFVLTVHDMIPELFSKMKWRDPQIKNKQLLCKKASHIITVSKKTKKDLMDILNVPEQKVTVIYHGAPEMVNVNKEKPIIPEKYILYVGNRGQYKCFDLMLMHLMPILKHHPEIKIVCTGNSFTNNELLMMRRYAISDRVIHLQPSDNDLVNLYANALCFIFPSVYEGFGIPILEAYQADCPVLLNNKSCFPEIAQDAAIYFNLDENGSDLEMAMERFLSMSDFDLLCLIDKQKERLKYFSWKKSAQQLVEVYEQCIEEKKNELS